MNRLQQAWKHHKKAQPLSGVVNLLCFLDRQTFLTKTNDVGVVLRVSGRDAQCMEPADVDTIVRKFEQALDLLDSSYRLYQYTLKRARPDIPHRGDYGTAEHAVLSRIRHLESKADSLYAYDTYFVLIRESGETEQPKGLSRLFSLRQVTGFLSESIEERRAEVAAKAEALVTQINDYVPASIVDRDEAFRFFRRLLNLDRETAEAGGGSLSRLDQALCSSEVWLYPDSLIVGDRYVRVLTLNSLPDKTMPDMLAALRDLPSECIIVSEWKRQSDDAMRSYIDKRKRHFILSRQKMRTEAFEALTKSKVEGKEHLADKSMVALSDVLDQALTALNVEKRFIGTYSLTIILQDTDPQRLRRSAHAAGRAMLGCKLIDERWNRMNAYCAALPAGAQYNLRTMYVTCTNYADLSFLFGTYTGEAHNDHVKDEYSTIFETKHKTPFFWAPHNGEVPDTFIIGKKGSGKSYLMNLLLSHLQKHTPRTFVLDIGDSYRALANRYGAAYMRVGLDQCPFSINPFSLPDTPENIQFLCTFLAVLLESGDFRLNDAHRAEIYEHITENVYEWEPEDRTLSTLLRVLTPDLKLHLAPWVRGGQYGTLFDNARDTLTLANFQIFDFDPAFERYGAMLEPLLFYVLHRANAMIYDEALARTLKVFAFDEAWRFFLHPSTKDYITTLLKTGRKYNVMPILATQSGRDLARNDMFTVVAESCVNRFFLANDSMDRDAYRQMFRLNDRELDLIAGLVPKRDLLLKHGHVTLEGQQRGYSTVLELTTSDEEHLLYSHYRALERTAS